MTSTFEKGKSGENFAKTYYQEIGYEFLESNYRFGRAEIDLIFLKDEKVLVFVEVKKRRANDYGEPESFVSDQQKERIRAAAEDYIYAINWKKEIRFDIMAISDNGDVEVFQDAF